MVRNVGGAGVRQRMTHRAGRPVVDPDRIGAAALAVLRRDGLAGVTMAAVAAHLGVSARTIYHYVPDRNGVLGLATMRFQRLLTRTPHTDDWRADLRLHAERLRALFAEYPGIMEIPLQAGVLATDENFYAGQEAAMARLTAIGLDPRTAWLALTELLRFVSGIALFVDRRHPDTGADRLQAENAAQAEAAGHYPLTAAAGAGSITGDEQFEFGLQTLLDGIARLAGTP